MLGSWQGFQASPGLQPVLVRQQGAEPLICQEEHGPLDRQAGHKVVVAPGEGPDA